MSSVVTMIPRGVVAAFSQDSEDGTVLRSGVTIVVCTYRRPQSVLRLLASLDRFESSGYPVLVVDASPDPQTEEALRAWCTGRRVRRPIAYYRVEPALRGLTRQRNFALQLTQTDLVCFFDDDIELLSGCVTEMERIFRRFHSELIGVAAMIANQPRNPTLLWRLRRALGMVASLRPGTYHGSGLSVPWGYVNNSDDVVIGDWLPGGATLWDASRARIAGFCEEFSTYAQAEDLEFSIRMSQIGKLAVATRARVAHLHASSGREQPFRLGYMAIRNRYYIHRRRFTSHRLLYKLWFAYAWSLDTLMLARHLAVPQRIRGTLAHVAGRIAAACDLLARKPDRLLFRHFSANE